MAIEVQQLTFEVDSTPLPLTEPEFSQPHTPATDELTPIPLSALSERVVTQEKLLPLTPVSLRKFCVTDGATYAAWFATREEADAHIDYRNRKGGNDSLGVYTKRKVPPRRLYPVNYPREDGTGIDIISEAEYQQRKEREERDLKCILEPK